MHPHNLCVMSKGSSSQYPTLFEATVSTNFGLNAEKFIKNILFEDTIKKIQRYSV